MNHYEQKPSLKGRFTENAMTLEPNWFIKAEMNCPKASKIIRRDKRIPIPAKGILGFGSYTLIVCM